ncbi:MAG TPA: COQ9 family protein [Stellaceae bacterium]|nr:COQ9 family protein [Stellaceae bacterium]
MTGDMVPTRDDERIARRDALLEATMPNVPFDGWSVVALAAGAKAIGLDPADVALLFPDGPGEAAAAISDWADRRMLERLAGMDLAAMKVRDRVAAGVRARLDVLEPYREAVRRAMALAASPANAPAAAQAVYRTVDAIWYAAGDAATDFNFYTKRALLAGVYGATVLYWLNDRSEGSADSWAFLDRRLGDIMRLPKLTARLRRTAETLTAPLHVLRRFRGAT